MPTWDDYAEESQGGGLLLAYENQGCDAYFAAHDNGGNKLVVEAVLAHPEDYPNIPNGTINNWFWLPKGWVPVRNGAAVEYQGEGDVQTKFWASSPVGQLVTQMKKIDPDGASLVHGTPFEAKYWKTNLQHAKWGPVPVPHREKDESGTWKTKGTEDVSMPVELLGTAGTNGSAPADFDLASLQLSDEILVGLRGAAAASKSYSDFLPKAVSVPGLPSTPAWGQISNTETGPAILKALQPF